MTPRRIAGLLLALWWVVYPLALRLPFSLRTVHGLLVVCLAVCAAALAVRRERVPLGPPVWAALIAVASLLVATFRAPELFSVAERWEGALVGLTHVLFFLCALLLVPGRAPRGDPRTYLLDPSAVRLQHGLAVALGLAALSQALVVFLQQDGLERVEGTLGNPNFFGAFVAAVGLAVGAFAQWQPAVVALLAVFASVLLQAGSRGAFLAAAVVLLAFVARRRARLACGLALAAAVLLWVVPNPLVERVELLDDDMVYSRPFLWATGLANVVEHPLGIGPGMNKYVFPADALDPARPWLLHQRHQVGLTHNVFLTLALEWGWLAAAACLGLLVWATVHALRPGRGRLGEDRLGQGAGLGAAVLLIESQVDGLEQHPLLFSLFLLLTAVVLRRVGRPAPAVHASGRVVAGALGLAAAALLVGLLQAHTLRTSEHAAAAVLSEWHQRQVDTDDARRALAAAVAEHPESPRLTRTLLSFEVEALRRGLPPRFSDTPRAGAPRVEDALAVARTANPADPRLPREAARALRAVYRRGGRDPAALERWFALCADVLALDPLDVDTRHELALEAHAAGRTELVDTQLDALFALHPDDAFAWWIVALRAEAERRPGDALTAYTRARQAIFDARVPAGASDPGARVIVENLLERVDIESLEQRRRDLNRRLRSDVHTRSADHDGGDPVRGRPARPVHTAAHAPTGTPTRAPGRAPAEAVED